MAQAYSTLLKNVELSEFPSNYCDVKFPMRANIRPKKLKSSMSLSFTCDITPGSSQFDRLD